MNSGNLQISEYEEGDYCGLIELWEDIHLGGVARGDTQLIITDTILNGARLFTVKDETGKIVGSSWITTDKRRNYVHHFGIREEYRGSGMAQKLLDMSLDFCRSTGLQVKLEVHRDSIKAIKLYEGRGFKYLGDYLVYIIRNYNNEDQ